MATIDTKIDAWKNKLLDLGKRNRLINYRETKRSSLTIQYPEIYDLWDSFVLNQNPLEFPYIDDSQTHLEEEDAEVFGQSVITNQTLKEQKRTLSKTYH